MKSIASFKRGDTFSLVCTYKDNGVASSVTSIDIDSQIRTTRGELICDLVVTKLADVGKFTLTATATESATWSVGLLQCDIQFSESGIVRSTETFNIVVVDEITK